MTRAAFPGGWYPLAQARHLRDRPLTRQLAGAPLRIERSAGGMACTDLWTGEPVPVQEAAGWILAALGEPSPERSPPEPLLEGEHRVLRLDGRVGAGLADVAENILDTTHTSVVHHGYLRDPDECRLVEAHVQTGAGWATATYPPSAAPGGWAARLIGAHRYTIRDRFQAPAVAEVQYTEHGRPVFSGRFALSPVTEAETYVAATLAVPGRGMVAAIKLAALKVFFRRILAEDRAILEMIGCNRAVHGQAPLVFAPPDLLRPAIEAILAGRTPLAPAPRVMLKV